MGQEQLASFLKKTRRDKGIIIIFLSQTNQHGSSLYILSFHREIHKSTWRKRTWTYCKERPPLPHTTKSARMVKGKQATWICFTKCGLCSQILAKRTSPFLKHQNFTRKAPPGITRLQRASDATLKRRTGRKLCQSQNKKGVFEAQFSVCFRRNKHKKYIVFNKTNSQFPVYL